MIDLAEATVDIQIPAGDAGMVDVAIQANDFFKATITALNTNFFPRFLIHNRRPGDSGKRAPAGVARARYSAILC